MCRLWRFLRGVVSFRFLSVMETTTTKEVKMPIKTEGSDSELNSDDENDVKKPDTLNSGTESATGRGSPKEPTNDPSAIPVEPVNNPPANPTKPTNDPSANPVEAATKHPANPTEPTTYPKANPVETLNKHPADPTEPTNDPSANPEEPVNKPPAEPTEPTNNPPAKLAEPKNNPPSNPTNDPPAEPINKAPNSELKSRKNADSSWWWSTNREIKKPKDFQKMSFEEKRTYYRCGDYVTLDKILPWSEYVKINHFLFTRKKLLQRDAEFTTEHDRENKRVSLWQGDITCLEIDAIVNAANKSLRGGGGVDGCIHRAAGRGLLEECIKLNGCETGDAKITSGQKLPAKNVIHTVGPIGERKKKLESCYISCLRLMKEHKLNTMAFCSISTGVYGYPSDRAAKVALETVKRWLEENEDWDGRIIFCVFLQDDLEIYQELMLQYFPCTVETKTEASGDATTGSETKPDDHKTSSTEAKNKSHPKGRGRGRGNIQEKKGKEENKPKPTPDPIPQKANISIEGKNKNRSRGKGRGRGDVQDTGEKQLPKPTLLSQVQHKADETNTNPKGDKRRYVQGVEGRVESAFHEDHVPTVAKDVEEKMDISEGEIAASATVSSKTKETTAEGKEISAEHGGTTGNDPVGATHALPRPGEDSSAGPSGGGDGSPAGPVSAGDNSQTSSSEAGEAIVDDMDTEDMDTEESLGTPSEGGMNVERKEDVGGTKIKDGSKEERSLSVKEDESKKRGGDEDERVNNETTSVGVEEEMETEV